MQAIFKQLLRKKLQTKYNTTLFNFYLWHIQAMKKCTDLHLAERT